MSLPALALFTRSLREDVRLFRPHFLRFAFVVFLFAGLIVAHVTSSIFGAPGLQFFRTISQLNFAFITLATVSYFATAITEEKDEQTLGLLKMAGMGSVALLLGKSTTRLIATAVVLAAQFPFTLLAITLGGVTMGQVVAVYAALFAYMIFCANLGLFCSVYCRSSGTASALTGILLFLVLAAPLILGALPPGTVAAAPLGRVLDSMQPITEPLLKASIWARLQEILATGFNGSPWHFQVAGHLVAAAVLFVVSCVAFEPLTRDGDSRLGVTWRRLLARRLRIGERRSRRAAAAAFVWKELHFGIGGRRGLFLRTAVYGLFALAAARASLRFGPAFPGTLGNLLADPGAAVAAVGLLAAAVESALQAARIFRDEVRQGTLPTIVLLPQPIYRIVWAKVAGCLLGLVPGLFLIAVGTLVSPMGVGILTERFLMTRPAWLAFVQLLLLLYLTAYLSLVVRWGALPLAIGIVHVLLPGIGYLLLMPLAAMTGTIGSALTIWELVCIPFDVIGLAAILVLHHAIARRLLVVAAQ